MAEKTERPNKRVKQEKDYRSFVLSPRLKAQHLPIGSANKLLHGSWLIFKRNWPAWLVIGTVYGLLLFLFVYGFNSDLDVSSLDRILPGTELADETVRERFLKALEAVPELTGQMLDKTFADNSLFLFMLISAIISLASFELLRSKEAETRSIRRILDIIYFGPGQMVVYLIVGLLLIFQLLPALVAANFGTHLRDSQSLDNLEQTGVLVVIGLIHLVSLYFIVGGLFGLVIASLKGARPFQALQTSLQITKRRRAKIGAYLAYLCLCLFAINIILTVLLTVLALSLIKYVLVILFAASFLFGHIYLYQLYLAIIKPFEKS